MCPQFKHDSDNGLFLCSVCYFLISRHQVVYHCIQNLLSVCTFTSTVDHCLLLLPAGHASTLSHNVSFKDVTLQKKKKKKITLNK